MTPAPPDSVTLLLQAWSDGNQAAADRLLAAVYEELHRTARRYMFREHAGHTLQATGLVHEAYLRLIDQDATWRNRDHFYAIAAQLMRRILVDHARTRRAAKRGGDQCRITVDDLAGDDPGVDLLDLERGLEALAALDPRQAHIVELRFFGGLTIRETATAVGVSHTIVEREWSLARAWLRRELARASGS